MLQELKLNEFERVRPCFTALTIACPSKPRSRATTWAASLWTTWNTARTAFALTVEGYLLAGEYDNPRDERSAPPLLKEQIFTGQVL